MTRVDTPVGILSPSDILTPLELCARLKVRRTWVYEKLRQRSDNPLPVLRCGRYLRFSWPAIVEWLQKQSSPRHGRRIARKIGARA